MPSNKSLLLSTLPILIIAILLSRAPSFMMSNTTPPSSDKPWADGPCTLIMTPQYATKKTDIFTTGATHMAHIHNAILRGYNSIYLQAPHVTDEDKPDFIEYALSWFKFVKSHHDDEEAELFPKVEEVLGEKDIWNETHKEHESFLQGLSEFNTYLTTLPEPFEFSASHLLRIMSSFQSAFNHHFHHEIETIASFSSLPSAPEPNSPASDAAATIFKTWGKKTVTKAGTTDVVPFFLLNLDADYEEGMWANWPPMPAPIRWGLVNIAGAVHWGWWKFASCDSKGKPKELYALQFPKRIEEGEGQQENKAGASE